MMATENPATEADQELEEALMGVAADAEVEEAEQESHEKHARRFPWLIIIFILLLLVGLGLGGAGYLGWQWLEQEKQALVDNQSRVAAQLKSLESSLTEAEARAQSGAGGVDKRLQRAEMLIQELRGNPARANAISSPLIEVESLLLAANHWLRVNADIEQTVGLLTAADNKLSSAGSSDYTPLREAIAAELASLQTLPRSDRTGLAHRLAELASQIDRLPLADAPTPTRADTISPVAVTANGSETAGWRNVLQAIGRDLRSLVSIHRLDHAGTPLLAPEEAWFLRQNIRLQLQSARLAVLDRDSQSFASSLRSASSWLEQYFNTTSPTVATMLENLLDMEKTILAPVLPNISGSLQLVRNLNREVKP